MPGVDYVPNGEAQYDAWLKQFVAYCVANEKELGLTPEVISELTALRDAYTSVLQESVRLKAELKGVTKQKGEARNAATQVARSLANQFKANPEISAIALGHLGLITRKSAHPLQPVNKLTVVGFENGINQLKWNRNGNSSDTVFLVEYSLNSGGTWFFAGAVSKVKFIHGNQTPGRTVHYRVFANRSGVTSTPTKAVPVYSQLPHLSVAKAA